jgi:hypothetical protein
MSKARRPPVSGFTSLALLAIVALLAGAAYLGWSHLPQGGTSLGAATAFFPTVSLAVTADSTNPPARTISVSSTSIVTNVLLNAFDLSAKGGDVTINFFDLMPTFVPASGSGPWVLVRQIRLVVGTTTLATIGPYSSSYNSPLITIPAGTLKAVKVFADINPAGKYPSGTTLKTDIGTTRPVFAYRPDGRPVSVSGSVAGNMQTFVLPGPTISQSPTYYAWSVTKSSTSTQQTGTLTLKFTVTATGGTFYIQKFGLGIVALQPLELFDEKGNATTTNARSLGCAADLSSNGLYYAIPSGQTTVCSATFTKKGQGGTVYAHPKYLYYSAIEQGPAIPITLPSTYVSPKQYLSN